METPVLTLRLEAETRNQLERLAREAGKTRSDFIRALIYQAIDQGKKPEGQPKPEC